MRTYLIVGLASFIIAVVNTYVWRWSGYVPCQYLAAVATAFMVLCLRSAANADPSPNGAKARDGGKTMTKKDYIKAAEIVSQTKWDSKVKPAERKRMAAAFVSFFQGDNPRFDRERFLTACGLE
jgi:hypothetical protein